MRGDASQTINFLSASVTSPVVAGRIITPFNSLFWSIPHLSSLYFGGTR